MNEKHLSSHHHMARTLAYNLYNDAVPHSPNNNGKEAAEATAAVVADVDEGEKEKRKKTHKNHTLTTDKFNPATSIIVWRGEQWSKQIGINSG